MTTTNTTSHIHLIRHGITTGNVGGWIYGAMEVPLHDKGINALHELRDQGIYPRGDTADIYTSGMLRTEQTLSIIYGEMPHAQVEDLQELDFGRLEGESIHDPNNLAMFDQWVNDPDFRFPGGESASRFYSRVMRGFNQIKSTHLNKVIEFRNQSRMADSIIICHGGVIGTIMEDLFPTGSKNMWEWTPDPGHGYSIEFTEAKATEYEQF